MEVLWLVVLALAGGLLVAGLEREIEEMHGGAVPARDRRPPADS